MKKLLGIALVLTALGVLTELAYGIYCSSQGDEIVAYPRFYKENKDGTKDFNIRSLLFPVAVEAQREISDTVIFTEKVIYPIAPKFVLDPNGDTKAEIFVAQKIKNTVVDSNDRIRTRLMFDFDGTSESVRKAVNPKTIRLSSPEVLIGVSSTASPEAGIYGFWESIQPGHLEKENGILAKDRFKRTASLLKKYLTLSNIDSVKIVFEGSKELQLKDQKEVDSVMKNPNLLNKMRYVEAKIRIVTKRLEITPFTMPIALPLYLFGLVGIWYWLRSIKRPKKQKGVDAIEEPKKYSWRWLQHILFGLLIISAIIIIGVIIKWISLLWLAWLMIILTIIGSLIILLVAIYELAKMKIDWKKLGKDILDLLRKFVEFILIIIGIIFLMILCILWAIYDYTGRLYRWWKGECTCCKVLSLLLLLLVIAFFILHFGFGYIHWN